jgi:hypothetical protein
MRSRLPVLARNGHAAVVALCPLLGQSGHGVLHRVRKV